MIRLPYIKFLCKLGRSSQLEAVTTEIVIRHNCKWRRLSGGCCGNSVPGRTEVHVLKTVCVIRSSLLLRLPDVFFPILLVITLVFTCF